MSKKNKKRQSGAKELVMKPEFRTRTEKGGKDSDGYVRRKKHKKEAGADD